MSSWPFAIRDREARDLPWSGLCNQSIHCASPVLEENRWYKLDWATRLSNSAGSGGFIWAALDGAQFAYQPGQNVFDGVSDVLNRVFLFMNYGDVNGPHPGTYLTGLAVWEDWPADASSHPDD